MERSCARILGWLFHARAPATSTKTPRCLFHTLTPCSTGNGLTFNVAIVAKCLRQIVFITLAPIVEFHLVYRSLLVCSAACISTNVTSKHVPLHADSPHFAKLHGLVHACGNTYASASFTGSAA